MTMYNESKLLRPCTARHNRKPDRVEEMRSVTFGYQMSKRCYPRLPDVLRSSVCLPCALAAALPSSNAHLSSIFLPLKGVEAPKTVLSILPNKREHTQAGLDSHLKTLYSLTLVLLVLSSLRFSQPKAWPARSMWFICLLGCLCQIGNISKHLGLGV